MKIAIKGHESRGKEVIQILESLGGKNDCPLTGKAEESYYYIYNDFHKGIRCHYSTYLDECKKYTLEEFEKEFPFKVGDKVTIITNTPYKIVALEYYMGRLCYKLDNGLNYGSEVLTLYKEMKEKRNITLTLDKAKEWYNKGGELKEVALQAYSEEELSKVELPKTWEEFCDNYPVKENEAMITYDCRVMSCRGMEGKRNYEFKDILPSKKSAEAHLAMMQLEQLRDCWRQGWKPTKYDTGYGIFDYPHNYLIHNFGFKNFLSFPTKEMAEEFLECFKDLIKIAGNLI